MLLTHYRKYTLNISISSFNIYIFTEKVPAEATFRGREFLWWDLRRLGGEPLASLGDRLSLSFKTRHPAGLLFYTGILKKLYYSFLKYDAKIKIL